MWATDFVCQLCAAQPALGAMNLDSKPSLDLSSLFSNQSGGGFPPQGPCGRPRDLCDWTATSCSSGG
jgi:hypothetical protein